MSTEGCSVGTKWWRTIMKIASFKGNFDLLLCLDQVGMNIDLFDHEIALRVVL